MIDDETIYLALIQIEQMISGCPVECDQLPWECGKDFDEMPRQCREEIDDHGEISSDCGQGCVCYR